MTRTPTIRLKGMSIWQKLEKIVNEFGADRVAYITVGAPVNMAGRQPVSMANMREVSKYCRRNGIKVVLDAARVLENCYFIKKREQGYANKSLKDICGELCSTTDACTMSAEKDAYVNIGGWLAMNEEKFFIDAKIWLSYSKVSIPMAAWPGATWKRSHAVSRRQPKMKR